MKAASYSPKSGLAPSEPPTVQEYVIDPENSAFRHWKTPYASPSLTAASYETTGCYTAMSFRTSSISGQPLNLGGHDGFIWAATEANLFVSSHGRPNRGHLYVNWTQGVPAAGPANRTPAGAANPASPSALTGGAGGLASGPVAGVAVGCVVVGALIGALMTALLSKRRARKADVAAGTRTAQVEVKLANGA